jgi:hypothetical protein
MTYRLGNRTPLPVGAGHGWFGLQHSRCDDLSQWDDDPASACSWLRVDDSGAAAATIVRPARVIAYPGASNGSIVTGIGTGFGATDDDDGRIKFAIAIPVTGEYVISVFYVNLDGATTSADISVSGVGTVTQTFTGTSVCCARVALAPMNIAVGYHTITVGNESGPGPSIDRIVIGSP